MSYLTCTNFNSESVDSTDTASLSGSTVVEKTWTNEEEQYARALREEDDVTVGCFGRAKSQSMVSISRHAETY